MRASTTSRAIELSLILLRCLLSLVVLVLVLVLVLLLSLRDLSPCIASVCPFLMPAKGEYIKLADISLGAM